MRISKILSYREVEHLLYLTRLLQNPRGSGFRTKMGMLWYTTISAVNPTRSFDIFERQWPLTSFFFFAKSQIFGTRFHNRLISIIAATFVADLWQTYYYYLHYAITVLMHLLISWFLLQLYYYCLSRRNSIVNIVTATYFLIFSSEFIMNNRWRYIKYRNDKP